METTLDNLGWNTHFEQHFRPYRGKDFFPGRVMVENRDNYRIISEKEIVIGEVTGKFLFNSDDPSTFPKVGDWLVLTEAESGRAIIHEIMPRKTQISRKVAGRKYEEQVIATNLDYIFIVHGLDQKLNTNRIERYLTMVYNGGCKPLLVFNKTDLRADYQADIRKIQSSWEKDIPVIGVSAKSGAGIDQVTEVIKAGLTFAFVGPSGAGKSSIINALIGADILKTREVRKGDAKGRHVTSRREMIFLQSGGILIDTPGIRELFLWEAEEGIADTFQEIKQLSAECHFTDCRHETERGCAVLAAVEAGKITSKHLENYQKLQREQEFLESKQTQQYYDQKKRKMKEISKAIRIFYKKNSKRRK